MKNSIKRTMCLLLTLCLVFTLLPVRASAALDSRVEKAINWAIAIANDNSHGYSQTHRNGPDYDCSSFVCTAFRQGGFNVSGSNWTGSMEQAFTSVGFKAYAASSVTLQMGDILLRHDNVRQHTELYLGNNQLVGAHWDYDGRTGDSSGKEIDVYYDSAPSWHTRVLRYEGNSPSIKVNEYFNCDVTIQTTKGKTVNLYKNINDSQRTDYFDQGQTAYSTKGAKVSDGSTWYQIQAYDRTGKIITVWLNAGSSGVKIINNNNKIDPSISFSPSNLSVDVGASKTVSINFKGDGIQHIGGTIDGKSLCDVSWGNTDWNKGTTSLTVTGKKAGNATITVNLMGENSKTFYSKSFSVTVNDNKASLSANPTSVNLDLTNKTSQSVTVTLGGSYPDGTSLEWGTSGVAKVSPISDAVKNGQAQMKVYAEETGSGAVTFKLVGDGKVYATTTVNVTVTAPTYTVSYNANGGSGAPSSQTKQYDKTLTLSSVKPTRAGYAFKGWATSPGSTSAQYQPSSSYSSNKDLTLYAVWERDKIESSITFSTNNLTLEPGTSQTVSVRFKGDGIKYLGYEPKDYDNSVCRLNWSDIDWKNGTTSVTVTGKGVGTVLITVHFLDKYDNSFFSQSFTVTVKSTPYTVFYDANGGTVLTAKETVTNGNVYGMLPTPIRDGYIFEGWYTSRDGGSRVTADTVVNLTADQTLYAHWTNQPYTVSFDANDGDVRTSGMTVTNGSTYGSLPTPTRDGYTFEGWYTSRNGGSKVTADTTVNLISDQTLYAHWTNQPYTVNFDANGGDVHTSSMTVANGGTYGSLPTPIRDGYIFEGWYTSLDDGRLITSGTIVNLTDNQTLYAHWKKDPNQSQTTVVFTDVNPNDWFAESVQWAVEQGITVGTSSTRFSPQETCSIAQILSFIWRANGSPEPTFANTFTDVPSGVYYEKPAVWAREMGLISGNKLTPLAPCTRAMAVEYLWKAAHSPYAPSSNQFVDVPSSYVQAVDWAVANGITYGTSDTTFSPDTTCTRAEIITFLYRNMA